MTYEHSQWQEEPEYVTAENAPAAIQAWETPEMVNRSWKEILPYAAPVIICGFGWACDIYALTALGFLILTCLCIGSVIFELFQFPERFGIGGLLVFGGTLIWLCHDYMTQWFGFGTSFAVSGPGQTVFNPTVVSRAAFWDGLFIFMMALGLKIPWGRWIIRTAKRLPNTAATSIYLKLAVVLIVIGLVPFFLWCQDPFFVAIFKTMFAGRTGDGAQWTVGRGNVGTDWGSYVLIILQIGLLGGVLAGAYATLLAQTMPGRVVGYALWVFEGLLAFGSGTRGEIIFMAVPVVAFGFLKHQGNAAAAGRRMSLKGFLIGTGVLLLTLAVVQYEAAFRDWGLEKGSFSDINLFQVAGNRMFSEGLMGYAIIPEEHGFFYDRYFGEGLIRPLPEMAFLIISHPIPRVIWADKPLDPFLGWYSAKSLGLNDETGLTGGSVLMGNPASFYLRYGPLGTLEGGLFTGWLMGISERMLRRSGDNFLMMLLSIGLATWLFRSYRGMFSTFSELWAFLVGFILLCLIVGFVQFGRPRD